MAEKPKPLSPSQVRAERQIAAEVPPAKTRHPRGVDEWQDYVSQAIEEAMREGAFDNLPGKGKPLEVPEYDPYAGPEAESYRILKNAGFVPEWIELRAKITKEMESLRTCGPSPERPSRIVEVNILVQQHNRLVPSGTLAIPKLPSTFGL